MHTKILNRKINLNCEKFLAPSNSMLFSYSLLHSTVTVPLSILLLNAIAFKCLYTLILVLYLLNMFNTGVNHI
jgi:hypothetical protein